MSEPIKRAESLKPLSREHHFGLLLGWKIRSGIRKNVEPERIMRYTVWFWENCLSRHFEVEETVLFPILGNDHPLIRQAKTEHKRLKRLFEGQMEIDKTLSCIEEELEKHIRFEERVLFNEIQKVASPSVLESVAAVHSNDFEDKWPDEFWV